VPGQFVLHFRGRVPQQAWAVARHDGAARLNLRNGFLTIPHATPELRARLAHVPGVTELEPDGLFHGASIPNDMLFENQWALGSNEVMGFPGAWRVARAAPATVAVIDSGIELAHPDLAQSLWTNPAEIAGNGL